MMVVVVVQLVLLTVAVLTLFAMMGELSTRVPARGTGDSPSGAQVRPVEEARVGKAVGQLPESFRPGAGLILVLSTSCGSCERIAAAVPAFFNDSALPLVGIAVSSASEATGGEFVSRHHLGELPTMIDPSGTFSKTALGVEISPAAVALDNAGVISSAVVFGELGSLGPWLGTTLPELSSLAGGRR